jgi:hypothetical protein
LTWFHFSSFFTHPHVLITDVSSDFMEETAEWTFAEGTVQHPWDVSVHLSDFEKALVGKRSLDLLGWQVNQ